MRLIILTALAAMMTPVSFVAAQESPAPYEAPVELSEESKERAADLEQMSAEINTSLKRMTDTLDKDEARHLMTLYNNYNILSTVKIVRGDVEKAVQSCSKNNPDEPKLVQDLQARFDSWDTRISSVIQDAEDQIRSMVRTQRYAKPTKIRSILSKADRLRRETDKEFDKRPITDAKECRYLLGRMDATEEKLYNLIGATLVTVPSALEE